MDVALITGEFLRVLTSVGIHSVIYFSYRREGRAQPGKKKGMTVNDATPLKDQLFSEIKVAIIQLADNEEQKEQQESAADDKFDGITTAPVKNLLTGKWEEMDIEAMEDGTVIQSTPTASCASRWSRSCL